jgi:hypothetical protein
MMHLDDIRARARARNREFENEKTIDYEHEHETSQKIQWILPWAVAAGVLLIYLATAAPGAWWGDGQELACAAWTLGIPHPPGYPLYTIVGHLVIKSLGWLDPGRALTVFSAVLLAASCGLLIPLFRRALSEDPARAGGGPGCECGAADLLPAIGAGLLLAFSRTVWDNATVTDVFPLTFFLGVFILRLAWTGGAEERPGLGRAAALGLVSGLAMLNHYSILALAPLVAFCVLKWAIRSGRPWRMILLFLACFGVMLLGYLYLPWRARANPALNFGDPSTLGRLWWVLRGGQFTELKVLAGEHAILVGLSRWLYWWGTQWIFPRALPLPVGIILGVLFLGSALAGLARLARGRWELGLGLLGAIAATAGFGAFYHIADIEPYFLLALPAAAVGWLIAAHWTLRRLRLGNPRLLRGPLAQTIPALLALAALLTNYGALDKSWDNGPTAFGQAVLAALPKDALVVTGGDNDIYALWYQQMVLGARSDVTVFGSNFIISGWYAKYFARADRPKIPLVIEDRPPTDKLSFDLTLISGLILPNLAQRRPVFVTYLDPLQQNYFSPKPVAAVLSPAYKTICAYPFGLPSPVLYELQPNPGLQALSKKELTEELYRFEVKNQ